MAKDLIRQFDFSAGELIEHAKRSDTAAVVRAGARQMSNFRILNTGKIENRSGRSALFDQVGRTDEVAVDSDTRFWLCFGDEELIIRDTDGAVLSTTGSLPWTTDTVDQIVWTLVQPALGQSDVVICFPDMRPKLASWDGSAWTVDDFEFTVDELGAELVPFFRVAAPGATLLPSGLTGSVTLTASVPVFNANHIGVLIRYANWRLRITGYTSPTVVTATVITNALFSGWVLTVPDARGFLVGQIVEGSTSGTEAEVRSINYGMNQILVQALNGGNFTTSDYLVGPAARQVVSTATEDVQAYAAVIWDEPIISDARGWPRSCAFDNGRLIFTDLPSVPGAIVWSSNGDPYNFDVGADASAGMVEIMADRPRVYHVLGGADEFVFTSRGIFYIPISETNPLRPGSVTFRRITRDAASSVRPVETGDNIVFLNHGLNRLVAIAPTGQTAQPYQAREASPLHGHLFVSPRSLAATTADDVAERYLFIVNSDGTVVVGHYDPGKDWVGFLPWDGQGEAKWVSALGSQVVFTVENETSTLVEMLDMASYLDGFVLLNDVPAELAAGGAGTLWFYANMTVDVMDGVRYLGTRAVGADGEIIPAVDDDLSGDDIAVGLAWTAVLEPFVPHAAGGQSARQTLKNRLVSGAVAYQNSTGFVIANQTVFPYRAGENEDIAPTLREDVVLFSVQGSDFDPRFTLEKSTPGPLRVLEISMEVDV